VYLTKTGTYSQERWRERERERKRERERAQHSSDIYNSQRVEMTPFPSKAPLLSSRQDLQLVWDFTFKL